MESLAKLVAFIENPTTMGSAREKAISELNLLGIPSKEIEETAYIYWQDYFTQNIEEILSDRLVIVSHLLADKVVNHCFEITFLEYKDKRKQMGIDDIQKFGFTGF
jgi:hypothetical protein